MTETKTQRSARYNAATIANSIASLASAYGELSGLYGADAEGARAAIKQTIVTLAGRRARIAAEAGIEIAPLSEASELIGETLA